MCSVLAGESICEKKGVSFRVSGQPGRLDVIFRMHPVGTPVPRLKSSSNAVSTTSQNNRVLMNSRSSSSPSGSMEYGNDNNKNNRKTGKSNSNSSDNTQRMTRLPQRSVEALIKAGMLSDSVGAV
uniref:Uncharacterized protein n=1 Tax=Lygus hesperus TaxID=30085 RepID=A0A0A9X724_LYGHE